MKGSLYIAAPFFPAGGETAEMPGMYPPGKYDVAGFAVGVAEKKALLPKVGQMGPGDWVVGLPSSGLHSNGFSLVRKLVEGCGGQYSEQLEGVPLGEASIDSIFT